MCGSKKPPRMENVVIACTLNMEPENTYTDVGTSLACLLLLLIRYIDEG
jgi:hypothetical protein